MLIQVCRRWNDVISGNDWLWKQISREHGFVIPNPSSSMMSRVNVTKSCTKCTMMSASSDDLQLVTENTTASMASEDFPAVTDNCWSDCKCQLLGYHPSSNCMKMFLSCRRVFYNFTSGQSLTTSVIYGHSDRITAIDYHNGYVATG